VKRIEPSKAVRERIMVEAREARDEAFRSFIARRREARGVSPAGRQITEALLRDVMQDAQLARAYPKDARSPREQLQALRGAERWNRAPSRVDAPAAAALTRRPPRVMDDPGSPFKEDSNLQIFGPPYPDQWTAQDQSGNADVQPSADKATGAFGYFVGSADGAASCGAGIWVQFVPTKDTQVQVRAYTPFDYQYDLDSQFGYTAHDTGGFGVFVLSWNLDGTGRFNDLDYRYPAWSDGTGWWEHHQNPSAPDSDSGYAYQFGTEAPYFGASASRVYLACIWGYGSSDAGGGYFGNAVSASDLNAAAKFVVVGEQ
jgi:hypothetical protein